jgi:hypothetical protein
MPITQPPIEHIKYVAGANVKDGWDILDRIDSTGALTAIARYWINRREAESAKNDNIRMQRDALNSPLANAEMARRQLDSLPKVDPQDISRADKDVKRIKDERDEYQRQYNNISESTRGGPGHAMEAFLRDPAFLKGQWQIKTDLPPHASKLPLAEQPAEIEATLRTFPKELKAIQTAPVDEGSIHFGVSDAVDAVRRENKLNLLGVTKRVKDITGGYSQGTPRWPRMTIVGDGVIHTPIDCAAILFDVFGDELKERLTQRALAVANLGNAMNDNERDAALEAWKAKNELLQRQYANILWQLEQGGIYLNPFVHYPPYILGIERIA